MAQVNWLINMNLSDSDLSDYEQGRRHAHIDLLIESMRHLGYENTEQKLAALIEERERAILALRSIYDKWPANLDLADAINIVFDYISCEEYEPVKP